jgi:enoyl-CoA hydratase/carnithine racemase
MTAASCSTVVVEHVDLPDGADGARLGVVRLNEPDRLNPLSWNTFRQIRAALDALEQDDAVRTVAITGTGRAFSAGGDLTAYLALQRDPVEFPRYLDDAHRTFETPSAMRKPVVALVNGVTTAGGLELVLACDFAYAARSARLGDAHMNYGQMGGGGVLTLLPRLIGLARARELVFSGRLLSAEEALDWGLVNRVVEDDQLLPAAIEFAALVARHSTLALANVKHILTRGYLDGMGTAETLRMERETTLRYCLTSEDAPEGLRAFAERRRGRFRGR